MRKWHGAPPVRPQGTKRPRRFPASFPPGAVSPLACSVSELRSFKSREQSPSTETARERAHWSCVFGVPLATLQILLLLYSMCDRSITPTHLSSSSSSLLHPPTAQTHSEEDRQDGKEGTKQGSIWTVWMLISSLSTCAIDLINCVTHLSFVLVCAYLFQIKVHLKKKNESREE